jgi:hypothetical protein
MGLKPGLPVALFLRIHGIEVGLGATKNTAWLKVWHTGQTCHGVQSLTALKGFTGCGGKFLPFMVANDTHQLILGELYK